MSEKQLAPPPTEQQRMTDRVQQGSKALEQKPGVKPGPKVKHRNAATGRYQERAAIAAQLPNPEQQP